MSTAPEGLLDAFWAYENALMRNDITTLDRLFAPGPGTLRGDADGLLAGDEAIGAFRRARRGAPSRTIVDLHVRPIDEEHALVVAVTAPHQGGRGLQTQLWERVDGEWLITAAHVAAPPNTFDPAVWRVVGDPLVAPLGTGDLAGESVAVKDLIAVAGFAVGGGVPKYLAEQEPRRQHATTVRRLLAAGASVRGIARTDQFAYSLDGDNPHYGTPVNAVVPGGLPGGSSSGCATAVALGAATIGLATDTGGSIRVPASYQGLWGLRTTHGATPMDGVLPLAPDFDTVGLLTRTPDLLGRAAAALLGPDQPDAPVISGMVRWEQVSSELPALDECYEAFRIHQAYQAWQVHGRWISAHPGALAGSVRDRFATAAQVTAADDEGARAALARLRARLDDVLGDQVLIMPTASGPAPARWADPTQLEVHRRSTLRLTCLAGITGRPVVAAPSTGAVGVSHLGPRGSESALIRLAASHAG